MSRLFFYVRVSPCNDHDLQEIVGLVREIGTVRDSGVGTAKDPQASWIELQAKGNVDTIELVRQHLVVLGIATERVPEVVQIERNEGRAQARQLDLFGGP